MKSESVIDPIFERPLLGLHQAMNIDSFWKAAQQLLNAAIPNHLIGLTLQHNPVLPMVARSTRPLPEIFFTAHPLQNFITGGQRKKLVRISEVFSSRRRLMKSDFYHRYLAPQNCRHGVILFFWKGERLICAITIMRTAAQGDLSPAEMKLLRQLYPQFLTVLDRLESAEREHGVRIALEEFLRGLPLPTIVLRWNLREVYRNQAAHDFCAAWEKGPEEARLTKARSPIPSEILDRCRQLKKKWAADAKHRDMPSAPKEEHVLHPGSTHLRAKILLKQMTSAAVARPHFLIECEDLQRKIIRHTKPLDTPLRYTARLTRREREITKLVCDGQSNQEIADEAGLSLPTVKRHMHTIFRKLEVTSRSRLIALLR